MNPLDYRRALVAPGTETSVVDWIRAQQFEIEWAPAPGGLAWWGSITEDRIVVASMPNRIGLAESLPAGRPALVGAATRWHSLLEGGSHTAVLSDGELQHHGWTAAPTAEVEALAQAADFVRRRLDSLPSVTVLGPGPWLGMVPFLGGPPDLRVNPPIPGLPGLNVVDVLSTDPPVLRALVDQVSGAASPPGGGSLPRRRLKDLTLRIP